MIRSYDAPHSHRVGDDASYPWPIMHRSLPWNLSSVPRLDAIVIVMMIMIDAEMSDGIMDLQLSVNQEQKERAYTMSNDIRAESEWQRGEIT